MVIKSCPLLVKDTETCVGSSLASYFVLFSLISLVSFYFVFISLISFRFVSFLLISFRFVFVDFVSFRFYFVSHFIGTPCMYAVEVKYYMYTCIYGLAFLRTFGNMHSWIIRILEKKMCFWIINKWQRCGK